MQARAYRITLLLSVPMIVYESITKGWLTFIMLPLLVIVLPVLLIFGLLAARRMAKGEASLLTVISAWVMLVSALLFYITCIGAGDTQEVLLFGFLTSNLDSPLTNMSSAVFGITYVTAICSFITLIIGLVLDRRHHPKVTAVAGTDFVPTVAPTGTSPDQSAVPPAVPTEPEAGTERPDTSTAP